MPVKKKEVDIIEEAKKSNKESTKKTVAKKEIEATTKKAATKKTAEKKETAKVAKKSTKKVEEKVVKKEPSRKPRKKKVEEVIKEVKEPMVVNEWLEDFKSELKDDSFETLTNSEEKLQNKIEEKYPERLKEYLDKKTKELEPEFKTTYTVAIVLAIILMCALFFCGYRIGKNIGVKQGLNSIIDTVNSGGAYNDDVLSFEYPTEWYVDNNGQFYQADEENVLNLVGIVYKTEGIDEDSWNEFVTNLKEQVENVVELENVAGLDITNDGSRSTVVYDANTQVVYEVYLQNVDSAVSDSIVASINIAKTE